MRVSDSFEAQTTMFKPYYVEGVRAICHVVLKLFLSLGGKRERVG